MAKKRIFSPIKGTLPDPNGIFCGNCAFRDKTEVMIDGARIPVGATKAYCDIYVKPNNKPSEILFQDAPCDYWVEDEEAT